MAKKDLYMEGRNCGMEYALRLVKQGGVEALRNRFGFGRIRLQRFRDEFERLAEIYLGDPDVDMNVFRGQLEKVGLKVDDLTVKDV